MFLPREIKDVIHPPIVLLGTKFKLVPWIAQNISWDGNGVWFEPFLGSGSVVFNIRPQRAILSDINPHIIRFYSGIYNHTITPEIVREYLEKEGQKLAESAVTDKNSYYYQVRERFNRTHDPLDHLFLSRTCFNGLMRYNKNGDFNASFGKNPQKLTPLYINTIVAQVKAVQEAMKDKEWVFMVSDWKDVLSDVTERDFVYLDPPYVSRYTQYYIPWTHEDANEMVRVVKELESHWALSMWYSDGNTKNKYMDLWSDNKIVLFDHNYAVGGKTSRRKNVQEALVIPFK